MAGRSSLDPVNVDQLQMPHFAPKCQRLPHWTEEPGGLPSMGSHRVSDMTSDVAVAAAASSNSTNISAIELKDS